MFGALVAANEIQSVAPPTPFVSVTVTLAPACTVVALTANVTGALTVNVDGDEVPPPGAGEVTVMATEPDEATSAALIEA